MKQYNKIISTLNNVFDVKDLHLENESFMHNVPVESESHFKLLIVSDDFKDLNLVQRHQKIYRALNETMESIHALSIQAFTLDEYAQSPQILESPDCSNK